MILNSYSDGNHVKYWWNMIKIRCLRNCLYLLKNCHKPFGQRFWPMPKETRFYDRWGFPQQDYPNQWTISSNSTNLQYSACPFLFPLRSINSIYPINTTNFTCFLKCFIFICIVFKMLNVKFSVKNFIYPIFKFPSFPRGRVRVRPHFHLPKKGGNSVSTSGDMGALWHVLLQCNF